MTDHEVIQMCTVCAFCSKPAFTCRRDWIVVEDQKTRANQDRCCNDAAKGNLTNYQLWPRVKLRGEWMWQPK